MTVATYDAYTSSPARSVAAYFGVWLAAALVVVAAGLFARPPAPVVPITIVAMTLLTTLLRGTPSGRAFAARLSQPALAWFHAWRLVPGAAFLVLYAAGALPFGFAVPGGIGDILIALLAPVAARAAVRPGRAARVGYVAWQIAGLLDLALVVRAAAVLSLASPHSMHLIRELPMGLLPTFLVPLTFAAHIEALRRLA